MDISVFHKAYLPNPFLIVLENKILNKVWKTPNKRFSFLQRVEKMGINSAVYGNNWMQVFGTIKCPNYIKPKEIETLQTVRFEDMETYIPSGYDVCLKRQYGDYMKLPPENKRNAHSEVVAEPFKPCRHPESLNWEDR